MAQSAKTMAEQPFSGSADGGSFGLAKLVSYSLSVSVWTTLVDMKFALIKSIPLFDAGMIPTFRICGMIFFLRLHLLFSFRFYPHFIPYSFFLSSVRWLIWGFPPELGYWSPARGVYHPYHPWLTGHRREGTLLLWDSESEGRDSRSWVGSKRSSGELCSLWLIFSFFTLLFPFSCTHTIPSENWYPHFVVFFVFLSSFFPT